jgi:DNA mismatch repair protein MutS
MTPMFEQYHRLKAVRPDALLFFRMGDFYELFFDDARVAAEVLELTLTARNKKDPEPIPMAGVPHHAAASYIQRLVDAGYRVAIAEQVEDPALAKGLVRREITRVVTPGIAFDSRTLDQRTPNYLATLALGEGGAYGIAVLDCSTGDFLATEVRTVDEAISEIARLEPKELIVDPEIDLSPIRRRAKHLVLSPPVDDSFADAHAKGLLIRRELEVPEGVAATRAAGAALAYGLAMTGGDLPNVGRLRTYATKGFMVLDATTRRNLELVRTQRTLRRKGSLLHLIDRTSTAMGGRLLREWLGFPLMDPKRIQARQAAVAVLVDEIDVREQLEWALKEVADLERIATRVAQGTAHARDLAAIARTLESVPDLVSICGSLRDLAPLLPSDLAPDVRDDIQGWLVDEPPIGLSDGGVIRPGAHAELDELLQLTVDGVGVLGELEQRERDASGIATLKLKRNKVFGYYLEVTRAHLHKVPDQWIRKQTLTNCERFITPELKELEDRVLGADERRKKLELELFTALRDRVAAHAGRLAGLARRIARLDALRALADVAADLGWCRPTIDDSRQLSIVAGRHPVVETQLDDERFVPNDLRFTSHAELIVLTGPNMAGKSTVMRQVALIVLLAQMGSFVPADSASIGLVDRIFTRVGASDDLSQGQSTFMVEMAETATILHEATSRSLILLDEIGRGTSTYDGLSIAWAVAEDLADRAHARTLFATHYHELCDLADSRENVVNFSIAVSEQGDEVVFLRRLKSGGASRSYGIQCARIAGLPPGVVKRAKSLLKRFEKHAPRNDRDQLSLFGVWQGPQEEDVDVSMPSTDPIREILERVDPDTLSPRDAHDLLYRLKGLAEAHEA